METSPHSEPGKETKISPSLTNTMTSDAEKLHILKIQRSCVHDGPGIRTTIFFQGCALRCLWCQNPESRSFNPEEGLDENYSISDIMEIVLRDKEYYFNTDGGVTLSGGEPLLQNPDSLIILLKEFKKEKIHISVETALQVPWENVSKIAPYVDIFFVDLKIVGDEKLHKKYTNHDGTLIHSNIKKLTGLHAGIRFRQVILPGLNDMDRSIKATADFLKSMNHDTIELLKYHNMYEDKAKRLNLEQESLNITQDQSQKSLLKSVELFRSFNIKAENIDLKIYTHKADFTKRYTDKRKGLRESDYYHCLEVSKLKTKYYKKNGFKKPTAIHRSERLAYVLKNKKVIIYPGELLVGNFTSKRVGAQIWEEHYGILFASIIHQINRQTPVSFQISLKDKLAFYFKILPFWARHSLISRVNNFKSFILTVAQASEPSSGFNNNMAAIAHYCVNYERILKLGTTGIIKEIEEKRKTMPEDRQDFYDGALIGLHALEEFAEKYADNLSVLSKEEKDPERRKELTAMSEICSNVPKNPARTFHEALQSMTLLQIAICIESYENAVSHGRLDQVLLPYYERDLKAGTITYEKAKELLALFVIKMDEVILASDGDTYLRISRLFETQSTDQTVTVGGLTKDGKDATNDLTYMLLDICELQPLAVNMTARIHKNSPAAYKDRIAEVYITGAPMPALYNDEVYIDSMEKHYPTTSIHDIRNYSIIGCVEPNASDDHFGNTDCANVNVTLPFLQALKGEENDLWNMPFREQLGSITAKFIEYNFRRDNKFSKFISSKYADRRIRKKIKKTSPHYTPPASMEELLERYQTRLNHLTGSVLAGHQKIDKALCEGFTIPLASTLFPGCIEKGKDAYEGGATLNSHGIQGVGITDVADSLYALDEIVFKQKLYTIEDVINAIDNNFEGEYYQKIRSTLLKVPKFGDDGSNETAKWENKSLDCYVKSLASVENSPRNGLYTAGYYALNVNIIYGLKTPALPSGRLRGTPLAHSVAPHYGMEQADLSSHLNSISRINFADYAPNGTTVTFTIDAGLFQGPDGIRNLSGLISSYFDKGGMQFQPNVIDRNILLEAYENPEKHRYLLVRVAGYCAYFNDLSDELKLAIINRTCYS